MSLDFRSPDRVDRLATLECALCGRTWRRVKPPESVRSKAGYQTTRLTLILPATASRWFSRGKWHRTGDDAQVLVDGDLGDVDDAARAHRSRLDARLAAKRRAADKKAVADAEAVARGREAIAAMDARDREREREEREARERDAAYE